MAERFEDYVPDLSRADALLAEMGRSQTADAERRALIGVAGRALLRKSWSDQVELGERIFAELCAAPEPEPALDVIGSRNHRLLHPESRNARPQRCAECWQKFGRSLCAACGGDGKLRVSDSSMDCSACAGSGSIVCPICEGSGKSVRVTIAYAEDRTADFAHVFAPDLSHALGLRLAAFIPSRRSVPAALGFELLDEQDRVDAYRGRRGVEEYRGHRLGSALGRARHYVERVRRSPSVMASRYGATAWPFALLRLQGGGEAALLLDEERNPHVVLG
jgi:hypothetical protein